MLAESCCCVPAAWVLVNMFAFFYILKLLGYLRVNAADEAAGLDASHHGGSAYPIDLDDDASHKGSSYNGNQSGYNKVCFLAIPAGCKHGICVFCSSRLSAWRGRGLAAHTSAAFDPFLLMGVICRFL